MIVQEVQENERMFMCLTNPDSTNILYFCNISVFWLIQKRLHHNCLHICFCLFQVAKFASGWFRINGWFQIIYQIERCSQDNGIHRLTFSSASILFTVCTPVSHPFFVTIKRLCYLVLKLMEKSKRRFIVLIFMLWMVAGL